MNSTYYIKYNKYKNKYYKLKNQLKGGSLIIGTININEIIKNVFENFLIKPQTDLYKDIILVLNAKTSIDTDLLIARKFNFDESAYNIPHTYKQNRYDEYKKQDCGLDSTLIYKNIDDALDFNIEKNKILKNVMFSELNKPEYISEPLTNWIDFNWVIVKNNKTNDFEFVVGMMKDNPIELGLKHTMIGFKNDLYLAGEGRIIKNHTDNKFYIQLNLNSSSWDINSYKHRLKKYIDHITLSDDKKNSAMKEFIALKLDEIINKIKNLDTNLDFRNAIVQITDLTLKRTLYGDLDQTNTFYNPIINNSIVNDGLLYYYKDNTDGCPPDTLIKNAHEYAKTNNKLYEIYPKIIKSQNKDYIHIDDVLVKINSTEKIKNEYTGLSKLELLDTNIYANGRKIHPVYSGP